MLTDQLLVACPLGLLQGVTYNEVDYGSTLLATRTVDFKLRGLLRTWAIYTSYLRYIYIHTKSGTLGYFLLTD